MGLLELKVSSDIDQIQESYVDRDHAQGREVVFEERAPIYVVSPAHIKDVLWVSLFDIREDHNRRWHKDDQDQAS